MFHHTDTYQNISKHINTGIMPRFQGSYTPTTHVLSREYVHLIPALTLKKTSCSTTHPCRQVSISQSHPCRCGQRTGPTPLHRRLAPVQAQVLRRASSASSPGRSARDGLPWMLGDHVMQNLDSYIIYIIYIYIYISHTHQMRKEYIQFVNNLKRFYIALQSKMRGLHEEG